MAQPLQVSMPDSIYLIGDAIIRVTARDPLTGADVAGVTVSNITLEVEQTAGDASLLGPVGPFMLVPGPGA